MAASIPMKAEHLTLHEITFRMCGLSSTDWDDVRYFTQKKGLLKGFRFSILTTVLGLYFSIANLINPKFRESADKFSGLWARRMRIRHEIILSELVVAVNEKELPATFMDHAKWTPIISVENANHVSVERKCFLEYIEGKKGIASHFYGNNPFWGYPDVAKQSADATSQTDQSVQDKGTKGIPEERDRNEATGRREAFVELITCEKSNDAEITFRLGKVEATCTIEALGYTKYSNKNNAWHTLNGIATIGKYHTIVGDKWDSEADQRRKQLENLEKRLILLSHLLIEWVKTGGGSASRPLLSRAERYFLR
ncbi:MAG: hypothetical protein HY804_04665 [Nitrospinae bacterium]|nr:hypothetical protein [Nitrospinota bacterium]